MPKSGAAVNKKSLPPFERKEPPTADQLWNAIEFSSRFPDLALELASVLKAAERPALSLDESTGEELKFPDLVPPDPREAKAQRSQEQQKEIVEQPAVFVPPTAAQGKGRVWIYLLIAATLFFLLLLYSL